MSEATERGAACGNGQEPESEQERWDAMYRERAQVWSGNANVALVKEVDGLEPGTALDLGCGEGADTIWLAGRGWRVTGVDISAVALERARRHGADAGVADRVSWEQCDLADPDAFPAGPFDLVSAHYLHTWGEMPRERILRDAAAAVAPGGTLLIVGHEGPPSWDNGEHADVVLPTADEVLASLELPAGEWEVLRAEPFERVHNDPEGRPGTRTDNVLKARRTSRTG
ncbi:class I SAM-dependent methyltransferase [Streptomyces sp. NRRL S-1868]|uniref:class I SAM-dependent methyltransferase n=1 Tax=Streptomyces sp. NRRL S-1868 TaxID=1463892 RepID=UPI0004CB82EA|nr:class I SAM-dependent methyltransferase [Streptomyces sp. NRRL S-1868]